MDAGQRISLRLCARSNPEGRNLRKAVISFKTLLLHWTTLHLVINVLAEDGDLPLWRRFAKGRTLKPIRANWHRDDRSSTNS
jgi:hypothetical protein